ncbi:MAG: hypothetical protein ACXWEY_13290 [Bacteroidia bacterium]
MKKSIPPLLLLILTILTINVEAQVWKDDFDKGLSDMQQADNIGAGKTSLSEAEHTQKLQLYKSAAESFIKARESNRKMESASTYFIATNLYKMSRQQSALGDDMEAYTTIKRAIDYWPDLNEVPASKFINEQRVRVNGKRETYRALGDVEDWQHAYFQSYIMAMQLANKLKKYDEAINYAEFILDEADTLHKENFIAWGELSKSYKGKNDDCQSAEYAMQAIDGVLQYAPEKPEDKEIISDYLDELAVNVSPSANCRFNAVKWSERAALALAKLHNTDDQSFYVLLYGRDAYNRGRQSAELLVALAEAEFYLARNPEKIANDNDKTDCFGTVEKRKNDFNSEELKRVAQLYKLQGKTELVNNTLRHAKKLAFWENTHFAFSTNPANFYWGQYLGVFDFMLPRQSHEFRVNYNTSSTHLFWKNKDDQTPGAVFFTYSGYELSYTLKLMEKDVSGVKSRQFYSGPQFRFENREYFPVKVNIASDGNTSSPYKKTVNARSDRYEALFMLGIQRRSKWFFTDFFFGVGAGYKTFTNNLEPNERAMDDRFREGIWNNIYIPVHTGFRAGVIFK